MLRQRILPLSGWAAKFHERNGHAGRWEGTKGDGLAFG